MSLVVADGLQVHSISLPARSAWASVNARLEAAIGRNVALRIPRPFQPFSTPMGQVLQDDEDTLGSAAANCYIVSHAHWRDFQVISRESFNLTCGVPLLMPPPRTSCPCAFSPMQPPYLSALLQCPFSLPSRLGLT
jgi:hypothetical protein